VARRTSRYVCQDCGSVTAKWGGRCDSCGAWNSITEESEPVSPPGAIKSSQGRRFEFDTLDGPTQSVDRSIVGIPEFDRVCGGGLVPGSVLLVGGDPGIGKSTLLLQVVAALGKNGVSCAYLSGEEAVDQVRMRARRLALADAPVRLAAVTDVRDILSTLDSDKQTQVVVVDSIQTMFVDTLESAPGTVAQVRAAAQSFIRFAKQTGSVVVLVGHVTKEGQIAGPRVLEHMVDTVLYFEGERGHQFRILRAVKNRFGPTDEIGVFEMTDAGLAEVANPSSLFLTDRASTISGTAVYAGIEGTRPVLVEIQALVSPSALATPRRAVVGWDSARLAMIVAVLEAHCGLSLFGNDIYLNVAGGLRISEPGADLAVAGALVSSQLGTAVPEASVFFGEVGLSGDVRPVSQADNRLSEAAKLGFAHAVMPSGKGRKTHDIQITQVERLTEVVDMLQPSSTNTVTETEVNRRQHG
jgi:DNA repair protein RadA/Sms